MPQAQQLGRYHLLDRIAYGGMAEIFRAKTFDAQGNVHLVAIKRLLSHLITDDEFLQMLVDEAKISATLSHQNIARVYEFGHAADEYFLAMEYVDGKDVRALLERSRQQGTPIPPEHAAWIAMEVASALQAAHTQRDGNGVAMRIVHRDVSPSNVLCSYRGDVKLCDFGIAKASLTRVQTKTGVIKGKVKYMSPEQAMGRKLDHRSDIFSLGTCLYEMLTLQAPFQAPTEVELIFAVRDARKRPVRELIPDVPHELQNIVDKAMTRSRTSRYQSGEQMALELRLFLDQYRPGYRRSNFSRYMRRQFAAEIEKELRQLENYTLQSGDGAQIGENLIADVLGPDAPFTRFTPVSHRHFDPETSADDQVAAPPADASLHDRATRIFDAVELGLRGRAPLPGTRAPAPLPGTRSPAPLPGSPDFHDQHTQLKYVPDPKLHDANTRLFDFGAGERPGQKRPAPLPAPQQLDPQFDDDKTVDRGGSAFRGKLREEPPHDTFERPLLDPDELLDDGQEMDFHEQATRIIDLPSAPTHAAIPRRDGQLPPQPARREITAVVRLDRMRRNSKPPVAQPDEPDEPSSTPLDDDDLEEI